MTTSEMMVYMDKDANLRMESLTVRVHIGDVREVFGRMDCLVQPLNGSGAQWVSSDRIAVIE